MTATPYTVITATTTVVFARKDRAVTAGEATGQSFTVTSPSGKIVHSVTVAPVVVATVDPEVAALAEAIPAAHTIAIKEDSVSFYTASGRNIPFLEVGSSQRALAEGIVSLREQGNTVQAAADALNISKATARRLINALTLTGQIEAIHAEEDATATA